MAYRVDEPKQLTLAEYEALPEDDGYRDEVSRGYLVREPRPGSQHGRLVSLISYRMMQYVEQHPACGRVYTETGFVLVEKPLTVRAPDVAFVCAERVPPRRFRGMHRGPPDLAIEVLSPGNRPGEMLSKVSEFLEAGTAAVWVVDPDKEIVVVHDQSGTPAVLRAPEILTFPGLVGFSLDIGALFADY